MSDGLFLVLEGGDRAGKSTQATLLRDWLTDQGRSVLLTREPGGSALGRQIRQLLLHGKHLDPRTEALLFAADRAHHVSTVIEPALDEGVVVISDRYIDSSIAYQGGGRALDTDDVTRLSLWATRHLVPDLTILLDVDPASVWDRVEDPEDRMEQAGLDFHRQVRQSFLDLAHATPKRYLVLDASASPHDIHHQIRHAVTTMLDTYTKEDPCP